MKIKYYLSISCVCIVWMTSAQTVSVRSVMQPYVDRGDLPGIITVIADTEKVISMECFGYQDIAKDRKMMPDALFWVASQTKSVTASAVMILVDEGILDLDEPVTTYLPELKRLMVARVSREGWQALERLDKPITLRHLLSHTSGMAFLTGLQQQMNKIDALPLDLSLYVTAMTPLLFDPGEKMSYSNQGIDIAGTVVERVSGMPFTDFVQKRIFDPLDMKSATFWPTDKQLEKLAAPYQMDENGKLVEIQITLLQYPLSDRSKRFANPGGGLFCTPSDFVKFYQMIANKGMFNGKRILSETAVAEMGKKPADFAWGLGWVVKDDELQHGGAAGTYGWINIKEGWIALYFIQQGGLPKHNEAIEAFYKTASSIFQ